MGIRDGEWVGLAVEGAWFEKFAWSRQLLNPEASISGRERPHLQSQAWS